MKRLLIFLTLAVTLAEAQTISTTTLDTAIVGASYQDTVVTTGGTAPRRVRIRGNYDMPSGLYVRPDGLIRGLSPRVESKAITFQVKDSLGAWSSKSLTLATRTLSAPTLSLPADARTGVGIDTLLAWNAVWGADKYNVQLDTNVNFTGTLKLNSTVTDLYDSTKTLDSNKTYYWKVRAGYREAWSSWSGTRSFTTVAAAAGGTVTYDTSSSTKSGDNKVIQFVSSTTDRIMIVGFSGYTASSAVIDSCQLGSGQKGVLIGLKSQEDYRTGMFYILNPPTGTDTAIVYYSGGTFIVTSIISSVFSQVNQTSPVGTKVDSTQGGGTAISCTVASGSNQQVVDLIATQGYQTAPTPGQILIRNAADNPLVLMSRKSGEATTVMSWSGDNNWHTQIAIPLKPN
jgi:hypothetical protein